eukprot:CAMPEP_0172161746 /NCGR_PEP_ID=MMETSP1050-20130122/6291_1 /TAXON_ID=233186 /ORGANISM="Cryptomonas curvata, Strain CCAP979/52" /LENGTH=42 /DNA_ID= /DNA_START= /DNA_END= /DNA_ORIENTATION=
MEDAPSTRQLGLTMSGVLPNVFSKHARMFDGAALISPARDIR